MENKKMIETIEKKLDVKVEEVYEAVQNGREVTIDVNVGGRNCRKVVLKELRNQYGPYYRVLSESAYMKQEPKAKAEKKPGTFRTKTERLCGARRRDILGFAAQRIASLADGTAALKEIEGPADNDTAIRFVLLLNADGSRFKEDIPVSEIREHMTV